MAIDFPASPTNGQTYVFNGVTYTYDGTKWTAETGSVSLDKIEEGNTSAEVIDTGSDGRFVVTTEGSERARVDSAGRLLVGTGTSSAVARIVCQGSAGFATSGAQVWLQRGQAAASIGNGETLGRINYADNAGNAYAIIEGATDESGGTNDYPGRLVFSTTANGASSPTERMRITSAGQIRFENAATSGYLLNAVSGAGGTTWQFGPSSSAVGGNAFFVYNGSNSGVYIGNGDTSWSSSSDERFKTNLQPITDGLSKVYQLRSVTGEYTSDATATRRSFLIAQDVLAVLPEAVNAEDPEALGLRYTDVIPLLVAALKESKERIETLEAANADLAARITALEAN